MGKQPIIIGHRGAMGSYPENTLPSFLAALEQGCDGIELDIQQSRDGAIMVFHDWNLERCSDGQGLLRTHSVEELRRLDAGSWFAPEFRGTPILTLQELLASVPRDKLLNIEVKELYSEQRGTMEKVVQIVRSRPAEQRQNIVVSSFSHNLLGRLHELAPEIKIGLLLGATLENLTEYISRLKFPLYSFNPDVNLLRQDEVIWAQKRGLRVFPWTVNDSQQLKLCQKFGVAGIISDYPDIFTRNI